MRTLRHKCIYKLQTRHLASRSIWCRIRQHVLPLLTQRGRPESIAMQWVRAVLYMIHSSRMPTVAVSVVMYYYHPRLLAKSNIEKQNTSHRVNDVCNGSPSRIRRVLRISFGMTILPRSSDCVNQVQKIFVKLQKALKYKDFQLSGAFTLVILIESF